MGGCMSTPEVQGGQQRPAATNAKGGDPPQAQGGGGGVGILTSAPPEQEETSTVLREDLINLHAQAKRASVEAAKRAAAERQHANAADAEAADERPDSIPEGREDDDDENMEDSARLKPEKPPKGNYKRLKNVFASPLEIISEYTAPYIPKSQSETDFLDKVLSDNFIFSGLTQKERSLLINAMEHYHAKQGDIIITQGDIGDYFYIMRRGKVSFIVGGKVVGKAYKGGSFGELALLYDAPRAATVRAENDCSLFRVDQQTFRAMLANNKAQSSKENVDILRKVDFFKNVDTATLTRISDALTTVTFHDDAFILRKGDVGKVFYIIKQGKVIISDIGAGDKKYIDQSLTVGDFFGERALLTGEKRAANVKAVGDCVMLCLSKDTFEKILGPLQDVVDNAMDKRKLMGVPVFARANLEQYEVDQLANKLTPITFKKGETLATEGQTVGDVKNLKGLILIKTGKITITQSSGGVNILSAGDYLGELSMTMKDSDEIQGTVVATEETHCRMLSYDDIEGVIGSMDRLGKESATWNTKLDPTVTLDVLEKHTILGAGTFGQVWLVSQKTVPDAPPYALKIQNKRELIKHGQVDGVIREKNLMASIDHPFVIKLVNAFQDDSNLFMVMTLIQGGELFSVIHTETSDGVPEKAAKFYAACVLEGLSYMHHRHILFRDLKPENVLIDKDGYCVLIDLGFAKVVVDKTYTLCGTPLYLAPEIILSRGYDKGVDHWSYGVLVYEMLLGYSPFYSHNIDQMTLFKRIVKVQYNFPHWCECSNQAQDLIQKILVLRQTERLGSLKGGDADIQNHAWFNDIKFDNLKRKTIKAPWVPTIRNQLDVSNFENWDHLEDKQKLGKPPSPNEQKMFKDF